MAAYEQLEQKLGFPLIRNLLADYCLGAPGKELVSGIAFSTDFQGVKSELEITDEFRTLMITIPGFPSDEYADLRSELAGIRVPGTFMELEALVQLRASYTFFSESIHFIRILDQSRFPHLHDLIADYYTDDRIISGINRILDEKGDVRDNASPELLRIRKEIASQLRQMDKRMANMLTQAKMQKWVNPDVEIAIRNGRMVIPVPAANKRKISGVIHDESSTGQTVYLEPTEVFEMNNFIRELELAEKREIIKILTLFADYLRPQLDNLIFSFNLLSRIDFIRAKTLFALEIQGIKPILNDMPGFSWNDARHPLLLLSHARQNKPVIPLDIRLNDEERILIISGPNAGGKSVCLKTVGLLQYMLQCGMLIPMKETSDAGFFSSVFIDIGDQQSIEDDLGTYSSHLVNIKKLLENATPRTLFLIDEFGSGTEPQSGGAIAEAVLEELNLKKAKGVVTTHYANLKMLAGKGNGFVNGAMLFDTRLMKPQFKLKIGKPGSSFAFEIAGNIQFPSLVLKNAIEKLGHDKLDFEKQIQELETEKAEILLKEKQLIQADEMLSGMLNKYRNLVEDLEIKKKAILEQARNEAKQMLNNSNKLVERTIREIRQSQAEKEKTKELRQELQDFTEQLDKPLVQVPIQLPEPQPETMLSEKVAPGSLKIGDMVTMEGQQEAGEVLELSAHDVLVAFRTIKLRVKADMLHRVIREGGGSKTRTTRSIAYQNMVNDLNARIANFRLSIDVRGYRAEEALSIIQRYIDESVMLRVAEVSILHGKGNGVLRQIIRDYLAGVPEVRQFADEKLELGGAGITVVRFR